MAEADEAHDAEEAGGTNVVERVLVSVDDSGFLLAPGHDVSGLRSQIEAAVSAGGRFIDLDVAADFTVSVLVSIHSHIFITVKTVEVDPEDRGDGSAPFEYPFDDF